jgi:hypothetical protein
LFDSCSAKRDSTSCRGRGRGLASSPGIWIMDEPGDFELLATRMQLMAKSYFARTYRVLNGVQKQAGRSSAE